ncbi:hypothetical protein EDD16DRAFT_1132514 [Pisolithus croceorrhizus]|nr:hypothetical protein EDD16DRAFT_1132514 [Pisolithus croceorrhizus]
MSRWAKRRTFYFFHFKRVVSSSVVSSSVVSSSVFFMCRNSEPLATYRQKSLNGPTVGDCSPCSPCSPADCASMFHMTSEGRTVIRTSQNRSGTVGYHRLPLATTGHLIDACGVPISIQNARRL